MWILRDPGAHARSLGVWDNSRIPPTRFRGSSALVSLESGYERGGLPDHVSGGQGLSHYRGQGRLLRGGVAPLTSSQVPSLPGVGHLGRGQAEDQVESTLVAIMAQFRANDTIRNASGREPIMSIRTARYPNRPSIGSSARSSPDYRPTSLVRSFVSTLAPLLPRPPVSRRRVRLAPCQRVLGLLNAVDVRLDVPVVLSARGARRRSAARAWDGQDFGSRHRTPPWIALGARDDHHVPTIGSVSQPPAWPSKRPASSSIVDNIVNRHL